MIQTVEAVINERGTVRLLKRIRLPVAHRVLVTILEESHRHSLLRKQRLSSEATFAADWNRPEEDAAWSHCNRPGSTGPIPVFRFGRVRSYDLPLCWLMRDGMMGVCQVTATPTAILTLIKLVETSFQSGSLQVTSYARPGKLFTANSSLMVSQVGHLKIESVRDIVEAVVSLLRMGIQSMTQTEGE